MTISSSASSSLPSTQYSDVARANKDSGDIGRARQNRDSVAEQKAVAELRKDAPSPASRPSDSNQDSRIQESRSEDDRERTRVGSNLDVKA